MKKTQLRHIIKESIKELMTEQNYTPVLGSQFTGAGNSTWRNGSRISIRSCQGSYSANPCVPYPNMPVGHTIQLKTSANSSPRKWYVTHSSNCTWQHPYSGTAHPRNLPIAWITNPGPVTPCPNLPTSSGCQGWSGFQSWVASWTNNNAFNSSNPNQPCSHICQRIGHWTNVQSNINPNQTSAIAQLQCKIDEGNNQSQIHGCTC
jgi:hypothetical protein